MIELVIIIAVAGFIVWLVQTQVPMPQGFKTAIYVVVAVCLFFFILRVFGVWGGTVRDIPVPQLR